jgi:hypothetical protein
MSWRGGMSAISQSSEAPVRRLISVSVEYGTWTSPRS